ncbi:HpcH/HpaI aldolase/citrate lyase family protein [Rhodococcoides kyotonense]|uniref:Citrate lyase subunit beta / citryl-CoA lyase n=1 Tax=Rhodococcoides kyotonense TaxID=398843 RepID=A0A239M0D0_9NOCA|nr:CoA ester lyase [Rhodococcus kyotonensis]SNT36085.1 citrate lyase subunit beta / citryl-CoA lyase [Rhodococcus kyotonensis]
MTETSLQGVRSLLFAPGDDARKLRSALASAADGVIADLEDAVAPDRKDAARGIVRTEFAAAGTHMRRMVRINGLDTDWGREDLALTRTLDLDAIVVPKATADSISAVGADGVPVIALVETAVGLRQAYEIGLHPRVSALMLGGADLGAELRWKPRSDGLELLFARSSLVVDSAAAGILPPFDVVHLAPRAIDELIDESTFARSIGFGGKACIHPCQAEPVNTAFSPSQSEIDWARAVVAAFDDASARGSGTAVVDGRLVDAPVVRHARSMLSHPGSTNQLPRRSPAAH